MLIILKHEKTVVPEVKITIYWVVSIKSLTKSHKTFNLNQKMYTYFDFIFTHYTDISQRSINSTQVIFLNFL